MPAQRFGERQLYCTVKFTGWLTGPGKPPCRMLTLYSPGDKAGTLTPALRGFSGISGMDCAVVDDEPFSNTTVTALDGKCSPNKPTWLPADPCGGRMSVSATLSS